MMFISRLNAGSNILKMRQARRKRNPRNALVYFKVDKSTSIIPTSKVVQKSDLLKIGQEVTVNWTGQQQFTGVIKFLSDSNAELLQKLKELELDDDKPHDSSQAVDDSRKSDPVNSLPNTINTGPEPLQKQDSLALPPDSPVVSSESPPPSPELPPQLEPLQPSPELPPPPPESIPPSPNSSLDSSSSSTASSSLPVSSDSSLPRSTTQPHPNVQHHLPIPNSHPLDWYHSTPHSESLDNSWTSNNAHIYRPLPITPTSPPWLSRPPMRTPKDNIMRLPKPNAPTNRFSTPDRVSIGMTNEITMAANEYKEVFEVSSSAISLTLNLMTSLLTIEEMAESNLNGGTFYSKGTPKLFKRLNKQIMNAIHEQVNIEFPQLALISGSEPIIRGAINAKCRHHRLRLGKQ